MSLNETSCCRNCIIPIRRLPMPDTVLDTVYNQDKRIKAGIVPPRKSLSRGYL